MDRCTECQNQLLEFVYDVLDDAVRDAVAAHLATCTDCQGALAEARSQQQLLAAAARVEFPAVRFALPSEPVLAPAPEIAVVPFKAPQRPQVRPAGAVVSWRRWLAAAAILLTLAVPAWVVGDFLSARGKLAGEESTVDSIDAKIRATRGELDSLAALTARHKERKAIEVRQQERHLIVSGPATYELGASGKLTIHTRDGLNQAVEGKLDVQLVDRADNDRVLLEEKEKVTKGAYELAIPPHLAVKANSQIAIRVAMAGKEGKGAELIDSFELQPTRYLTHLATDKPMYQPGEVVRFRALTLERFSLHPASEPLDLRYQVLTPVGGVIDIPPGDINQLLQRGEADGYAAFGKSNPELRGISGGEWRLPKESTGGEYKLVVSDARSRFASQTRTITVNQYRKPRLNKELEFTRKTYGPGDEVVAACKATTVEGPVTRCPVHVTVTIDDKQFGVDGKETVRPIDLRTDEQGKVNVQFKLPAEMKRGVASINVEFDDGGSPDPLTKPIPVVLNKLDVEFYPEGGEYIAGTPNRVYFQARTMLGKPAELKGRIVNDNGLVVASLETLADDKEPGANQGMGVFTFTPEKDRKYELKIDRPANMVSEHKLNSSIWGEVGLTVPSSVTTAHQPIEARVRSVGQERTLLVGAYCRGRMFDHKRVTVPAGKEVDVTLNPVQGIGGVYRITVFEEIASGMNRAQLIPRAERLIFRQHRDRLNLEVLADNKELAPGEKVKVSIKAKGENQEPVSSAVAVAVVDKALLTMADEKTARSMPTHFYLMSEVRKSEDLEHTDFLLTSHPKAAQALDLLLATQGWRRFSEQNPQRFRENLKNQADALAAVMTPAELPRVVNDRNPWEQQAQFEAKLAQEWQQIDAVAQPVQSALVKQESELQKARDAAIVAPQYVSVREKVGSYHDFAQSLQPWYPIVAVFLIVVTCLVLARAFTRPTGEAGPSLALAVVCVVLVVAGGVFTFGSRAPGNLTTNSPMMADAAPRFGTLTEPTVERVAEDMTAPKDAPRIEPAKGMDPKMARPQEGGGAGFPAPVPPSNPATTIALPGGGGFGGFPGAPMAPRPDLGGNFGIGGGFQGGFAGGGLPGGGFPGGPAAGLGGGGGPRGKMIPPGDARDVLLKAFDDESKKTAGDKTRFTGGSATRPYSQPGKPRMRDGQEQKNKDVEAEEFGRQMRKREAVELLRKDGGKDDRAFDAKQAYKEMLERDLDRAPFFVREYRNSRRAGADVLIRSDFADTIFWHPALLVPKSGQAQVEFELNDNVTVFQVTVFGHTQDGRIAAATTTINSRLPLVVTPAVPVEITSSDKPIVPATVTNATPGPIKAEVKLAEKSGVELSKGLATRELNIAGKSQARSLFQLEPTIKDGIALLTFTGQTKPQQPDITARYMKIVPEGFPVNESRGDLLEGGAARQTIQLPTGWVPGTLEANVQLYPSTLADLQKGLEGLLREPYGCFEQTSTANYPNVMILDYLQATGQVNPEAEKRARQLLEKGYQKLTSFECETDVKSRRGYEWFGGKAPPHEVLSAYGLMQFRDMSRLKATEVDQAMMERTRAFLMSQKDGEGGFKRNPKALDTFGRAPQHITNAYIVWALTESGPDDVDLELKTLHEQAQKSEDPYFLSLVANSLVNRGKSADAVKLLQKVVKAQQDDGRLEAKETSITGSGGRDLQIETTALAMLGWLKADPGGFHASVQKAVKWIGQQRGGHGAFGSTQSTILALKALIAYAAKNRWPAEGGEIRVLVGDEVVSRLAFPAKPADAITIPIPNAEKNLKAGKNAVRIEVDGKNQFPYTVGWSYRTLQPISTTGAPVSLTTSLSKTTVKEGDSVRLNVRVQNTTDKGQGMAVAIVGLPGGLVIPEDMKQLLDYKREPTDGKRPQLSTFEIRGRELILYWRDLGPKEQKEVSIDLSCRYPGEYSGPASRAYLYYNADHKLWVEPLKVMVTPSE